MLKQAATADVKLASVMIVGGFQLEGGPFVDVLWSTRSNFANHAVAPKNMLEGNESDGVDQEVMSWLKYFLMYRK